MYPYAYLVWCLIFAVVWALLYFLRKDTRKQMLLMSLFVAPLGPIDEYFHLLDYWRPETITGTAIGIEDVLIAFLIGGISAVLYEFLYAHGKERAERPGILPIMLLCYVIGAGIMYGGMQLGLSSMQSAFTVLVLFAAVPVIARPWLFRNAFLSGVAFMTFLFLFYKFFFFLYPGIVDAWWIGASGIRVLGVPVEEITWGFLWGMVAGPGSELVARLKLPRYSRRA